MATNVLVQHRVFYKTEKVITILKLKCSDCKHNLAQTLGQMVDRHGWKVDSVHEHERMIHKVVNDVRLKWSASDWAVEH